MASLLESNPVTAFALNVKQLTVESKDQTLCHICTDILSSLQASSNKSLFPEAEKLLDDKEDLWDCFAEALEQKYESLYVRFAHQVYVYAGVHQFSGREDIGFEGKDFEGVSHRATLCMQCFDGLLKSLALNSIKGERHSRVKGCLSKITKCVLFKAFLLCVQHQTASLWTDQQSLKISQQLLQTILNTYGAKDVSQLLCDNNRRCIFQDVLQETRQKLTKDQWKQNPGLTSVFIQCLQKVKFPHTSDYLDSILPPVLLITDDHQNENKILGVTLLAHIMENCTATELSWQGRAEVIYDSLQRLTYVHEPSVLDVLYPCLLKSLSIVEKSPRKVDSVRSECKLDIIMQRLLYDMELEDKLALRRVYSKQIPLFIETLGITTVKHFKRLFRVIFAYLEIPDPPNEESRVNILVSLKMVMKKAWARIPSHSDEILQALVKMIYDLSLEDTKLPENKALITVATECLSLLHTINPDDVKEKLHAITSVENLNLAFVSTIEVSLK